MRLPPFRLERFFARFEFEVPYLLGSSDCEPLPLGRLLELESDAERRLAELPLSYVATEGSAELREAIAGLYEGLEPDEVLPHTASVEALFVLMNVVLEPGDRVVALAPHFQPLSEIARGIGCTVEPWPARPENGWRPDLDELEGLLTPRTRLLVINFPHNPTGYLASREELFEVLRLARERDVQVFSDEIFRLLEYDESGRLPAACELDERAVSLSGMSKVFGLPGLRTGWLASRNRELLERALGFKDYTTTCAPAVSEFLSALALRHWQEILAANRERVVRNLALLENFAGRHPDSVEWIAPRAGTVAFPRLRVDGDLEAWCRGLAEQRGVLVVPGATFGHDDRVRIGFGRGGFATGLERLEAHLTATR
jgi:aspartate/methionine/tyrosine aminotransferase